MPLNGPSSYVSTLDEYLAHWLAVNTELGGAGPMLLTVGPANAPESVAHAATALLRGSLDAAQDKVQSAVNAVEIRRGTVSVLSRALLEHGQAFGRFLRGKHPAGSPYVRALPEMPILSAGPETFLRPMRDVRDLWSRIEDETEAFPLPSGKTRVQFSTEVTALASNWQGVGSDELNLKLERERRNAQQARAELILGRYRPTVEALFPPEHPLVTSIPRLRPLPGHTPEPVTLTAGWDAAEGQAQLEWTASDDVELAFYHVRMCPAATYEADAESTIAVVPAAGPRLLLTLEGLPGPGDNASYKVFVVLSSGNERGSEAMTVSRP